MLRRIDASHEFHTYDMILCKFQKKQAKLTMQFREVFINVHVIKQTLLTLYFRIAFFSGEREGVVYIR